jgi:hypothetical protein
LIGFFFVGKGASFFASLIISSILCYFLSIPEALAATAAVVPPTATALVM